MSKPQTGWEALKEGFNWTKKTVVYSGSCPHCKKTADFYQSPLGSLSNAAKALGPGIFAKAFVSPKKTLATHLWNLATKSVGEHGLCMECERGALKCPKCQTINVDDGLSVTCIGCGRTVVGR